MRGLTAEEAAVLRGDFAASVRPGHEFRHDDPTRAVCEKLRLRGCLVELTDARGFVIYDRTDLGRLALRVAVATPAVL